MVAINENYAKLKAGYLFPEISRRVNGYAREHPDAAEQIIRCGIGDVTEPLPEAARQAMHRAIDELGDRAGSFYAQAWLLVHFLLHDGAGRPWAPRRLLVPPAPDTTGRSALERSLGLDPRKKNKAPRQDAA